MLSSEKGSAERIATNQAPGREARWWAGLPVSQFPFFPPSLLSEPEFSSGWEICVCNMLNSPGYLGDGGVT